MKWRHGDDTKAFVGLFFLALATPRYYQTIIFLALAPPNVLNWPWPPPRCAWRSLP